MIALLSALLGFISSATPDIFRLFRDARDREHELAILKLQMEHDKARIAEGAAERQARLEAITLANEQAEQMSLNARLKEQLTGIHWVDALAGSVRPVLTYSFFLLYAMVKTAQFHLLMHPVLPWAVGSTMAQALVLVWSEEDIAIFSAIMAFWFGSRVMRRSQRG